jgi:hypothetical protein
MALQLGDDQQVKLTVNGVDDAGNTVPAQLDAPATFASSDESVLTVAADPSDASGASCVATATGTLGSATITATGSGGSGNFPLNLSFDIDVVTTAEIGFAISAAQPTHK